MFDHFGSDGSDIEDKWSPETILTAKVEPDFRDGIIDMICAECGYTAENSDDLLKHLETGHVRDLPVKTKRLRQDFSCGYCTAKFKKQLEVVQHQKQQHAEE
jgi:uncharacterized C2H2 Zn-finger protein